MGGCSGRDGPVQPPGHHNVCRGAAYSCFRLIPEWVYPAGALEAVTAAKPRIAKTALRGHGFIPVPDRVNSFFISLSNHLLNSRIDTLFLNFQFF
jgi:hypothetical protein